MGWWQVFPKYANVISYYIFTSNTHTVKLFSFQNIQFCVYRYSKMENKLVKLMVFMAKENKLSSKTKETSLETESTYVMRIFYSPAAQK